MWEKDRIKLSLAPRRYTCLDSVILTTYYISIVVIMIVAIELFIATIGIMFHMFMDLRLLGSYLSVESNLLICISIFLILSAALGLLSAFQCFYFGIVTSIALLILLLGSIDVYSISNYRIKNYISPIDLYHVFYDAIINTPLENVALHVMQKRLACCGIYDYTDWVYTFGIIPGSCCDNTTICDINDPSLNKEGCLKIVETILSNIYENITSVIMMLNIIGVIVVFTGYFYSYLLRQLKKGDKILHTAIPRVPMSYNAARGQHTRQTSNMHNNRSSIQTISDHITPSAPSQIYPNLNNHDLASHY